MNEAKEVVVRRIYSLGLTDYTVTVQEQRGEWTLTIELPVTSRIETVRKLAVRDILLEFKERDDVEGGWIPASSTVIIDGSEKELILSSRYFHDDVSVVVQLDELTREPVLRFVWGETGQKLSQQITSRLIGKQMAVYVNDEPLLDSEGRPIAPVIRQVMSYEGEIRGLSRADALQLARLLNDRSVPCLLGRWVEAGQHKVFEPYVPSSEGDTLQ